MQNEERRDFLKKTAVAGVALGMGTSLFGNAGKPTISCKGYAAFDESGVLKPWKFERRAVGEYDICFEVKAASICHSDIHQEMGHWGKQIYPQVPGHEIVGVVTQVGDKVTKFKVGDRVGVGCMVDNTDLKSVKNEFEQEDPSTLYTYGSVDKREPTGITQGGYSDFVVLHEHFAVKIPDNVEFEKVVPLLCAGITTYSPLMKYKIKKGDKVAVAGIGGLGHMAVKIAVSLGAEVTAFTTTADKKDDILKFGAKEVVVVSDANKDLAPFKAKFDYMLSTIPYAHEIMPYVLAVKPYGTYTIVGMPVNFEHNISLIALADSNVSFTASKIGGMKETQEMVDYCVSKGVLPQIEVISADKINEAWQNVINKKARFRYVIDPKTF